MSSQEQKERKVRKRKVRARYHTDSGTIAQKQPAKRRPLVSSATEDQKMRKSAIGERRQSKSMRRNANRKKNKPATPPGKKGEKASVKEVHRGSGALDNADAGRYGEC